MKQQNSISDTVFNQIEAEILSGVLKKGDYISENKLAERFNVSRTPVREAIKRLEQEDLIEYENCKTLRVIGISKEDVLSVYDIRLLIEGDAMVLAALNMTDSDYSDLSQTIDLQEFYTIKGDADKVKDADTNFHTKLYKLIKSPVYFTVLYELHKKIQQFRKVSQSNKGRGVSSIKEHRAILDAMRQKDCDLIKQLTKQHVQNARDNIVSIDA
ncbi:MAG: GntR family transcriptional regulator [Clostridia bacterium]|nr:GntR family transcriptional regulator [Clostridia bacterium]